jgi:hypothetical protein
LPLGLAIRTPFPKRRATVPRSEAAPTARGLVAASWGYAVRGERHGYKHHRRAIPASVSIDGELLLNALADIVPRRGTHRRAHLAKRTAHWCAARPHTARTQRFVAQLSATRRLPKPGVAGSSPVSRSSARDVSCCREWKRKACGVSPLPGGRCGNALV